MRLDSPVHDHGNFPQSGQPGIHVRNETETSGIPFQSDVKLENDPYIPQISSNKSPRIMVEKIPCHQTNRSK